MTNDYGGGYSLYDIEEWREKMNTNPEPPKEECICSGRVDDSYLVHPNPDCPVHGALHGKNPYKEGE